MMKDIILFDLDGTLTDPKAGITKSVQYALQCSDIYAEPDELCTFIGPPLRQSFIDLYGFDHAGADKAVEKYREYFADRGIYENVLYDGMTDMLKQLKELGKTLILATSKPTVFAERILSHFSLDSFFTYISGSELNGDRSDKREVILYAFAKNNICNMDRCIMVGDRKHDIMGAKGAGIDSIGVLYGYGSREELSEAGATYLVQSVAALSDLLCNCE